MVRGREEDLSKMVPIDAHLKGMTLVLVDPRYQQDPVYLVDRDGKAIHEWPYVPTMGEVDDACRSN